LNVAELVTVPMRAEPLARLEFPGHANYPSNTHHIIEAKSRFVASHDATHGT